MGVKLMNYPISGSLAMGIYRYNCTSCVVLMRLVAILVALAVSWHELNKTRVPSS